jgi:hypothetical protein
MKRDLTDISGRPVAHSLSTLSAQLDVSTLQEKRADGLVASLAIANHGGQDVSLLNPFELVQFQLLDAKGYPLTVPMKPPSLLVHRPDGQSWRTNNPLRVIAVRKNNQAVDASLVDGKALTLAAGDEYEVTFEIDHVREKRNGSDVDIPIPDGEYKIGCIATLINSADTNESRILQSLPIEVHFVKANADKVP